MRSGCGMSNCCPLQCPCLWQGSRWSLWLSQNLRTGLFAFWSPSDQDGYLRPHVQYKLDDHWIVEMGGNLFAGDRDDTFFGQFSRNNNLYAAVRYGF